MRFSYCGVWQGMCRHLTLSGYMTFIRVIRPRTNDTATTRKHYLNVGRIATVFGVLVSIAAAYLAACSGISWTFFRRLFNGECTLVCSDFLRNVLEEDYRSCRICRAAMRFPDSLDTPRYHHSRWRQYARERRMAGDCGSYVSCRNGPELRTAIYAWVVATGLTVSLSLMTRQKKSDEELRGLVYSLTPRIKEEATVWYKRTTVLAVIVGVVAITLTILFW